MNFIWLEIVRFAFFIGMFLIASWIVIPKAVSHYYNYKKDGSTKELSKCIECILSSVLILAVSYFFLVQFVIYAPNWP